ncbi:MAG: NDP-sugar synthase [bacterium]
MSKVTTIILTGGVATRMRPFSVDKSKSIIPFMGKPLLFHLIKALKLYEFSDIIFTSSGKEGDIKEYFSEGKKFGVNIKYYNGEKYYGTAGTIKYLIEEIKDEISNTFMVIYGDSLLKVDYKKMLQFHIDKESWCTILYHHPNFESFLYEYHDKDKGFKDRGKRTNYGVMDIDSNNRMTKAMEKPLITEIKNDFANPVANAAVYLLEKEILKFIPTNRLFDFPRDLFPLLIEEGVPCFGFDIEEGYRVDIGTIPNYYNAHFAILEKKIDFDFDFPLLQEGIWIGKDSIIGSINGLKKPVLICENSRICLNTTIESSIIGNNVFIGEDSFVRKSIILDNVRIGNRVKISYSIIGGNSFIGDRVSLPPNTILGNYCHLGGSQLIMKESDFEELIRR